MKALAPELLHLATQVSPLISHFYTLQVQYHDSVTPIDGQFAESWAQTDQHFEILPDKWCIVNSSGVFLHFQLRQNKQTGLFRQLRGPVKNSDIPYVYKNWQMIFMLSLKAIFISSQKSQFFIS